MEFQQTCRRLVPRFNLLLTCWFGRDAQPEKSVVKLNHGDGGRSCLQIKHVVSATELLSFKKQSFIDHAFLFSPGNLLSESTPLTDSLHDTWKRHGGGWSTCVTLPASSPFPRVRLGRQEEPAASMTPPETVRRTAVTSMTRHVSPPPPAI